MRIIHLGPTYSEVDPGIRQGGNTMWQIHALG